MCQLDTNSSCLGICCLSLDKDCSIHFLITDINECSTSDHGCEHGCVNTEGSYVCQCRDGYSLNSNRKSCFINCNKTFVEPSGSFQTPDWPDGYPLANFTCEWIFNISTNGSILFTIDSSIYGINGSPPCHSDYLQLFDGLEDSSLSLGKFCKLRVPPPITTSSEGARVIFVGTDSRRPASRKGVRISYRVTDWVTRAETLL